MQPLRLLLLTSILCAIAVPSYATWTESGNVTIRIVGELGGLEFVEANQIGLGADVYDVFVGTNGASGILTVTQQTDVPRTDLGTWTVWNGQGNVQGVYGDGRFFVGAGTDADDSPGVLEFLNSDVTGAVSVRNGNCNVRTGSSIGNVDVFPFGRLDVVEGSSIDRLTTRAGSFTVLQDSSATSDALNAWAGNVRIDDSILTVDSLSVYNGGDVAIGVASFFGNELTITDNLEVSDGDLFVTQTTVSAKSIDMRGADSSFVVAGGTWAVADFVDFHPSSTIGPVTMDIRSSARLHTPFLRVSGHPAYQHLLVQGPSTELEVDDALIIGEYQGSGGPTGFTGNMTVSDGATVVVHGELAVRSGGVLNIESGATVYAMSVDDDGTINENGGQLVLPEPSTVEEAIAAFASLAAIARRGRAA